MKQQLFPMFMQSASWSFHGSGSTCVDVGFISLGNRRVAKVEAGLIESGRNANDFAAPLIVQFLRLETKKRNGRRFPRSNKRQLENANGERHAIQPVGNGTKDNPALAEHGVLV